VPFEKKYDFDIFLKFKIVIGKSFFDLFFLFFILFYFVLFCFIMNIIAAISFFSWVFAAGVAGQPPQYGDYEWEVSEYTLPHVLDPTDPTTVVVYPTASANITNSSLPLLIYLHGCGGGGPPTYAWSVLSYSIPFDRSRPINNNNNNNNNNF
jgi:hypothetical protein